jgi:integrase
MPAKHHKITDAHLRKVAEVYKAAEKAGKAPRQAVKEHFTRSTSGTPRSSPRSRKAGRRTCPTTSGSEKKGRRDRHSASDLATLRNAYNVAVKRPGMIDWNPCLAIELPPEERDPARVWSPEQVATFFESSKDDRLSLLYEIVLLRGLRRGEVCGLRWSDLDEEAQRLTIAQTILQLGGQIIVDTPKTKAGRRFVSLDSETFDLFAPHRTRQKREKLAAGEAYADHGLIFCRSSAVKTADRCRPTGCRCTSGSSPRPPDCP